MATRKNTLLWSFKSKEEAIKAKKDYLIKYPLMKNHISSIEKQTIKDLQIKTTSISFIIYIDINKFYELYNK